MEDKHKIKRRKTTEMKRSNTKAEMKYIQNNEISIISQFPEKDDNNI